MAMAPFKVAAQMTSEPRCHGARCGSLGAHGRQHRPPILERMSNSARTGPVAHGCEPDGGIARRGTAGRRRSGLSDEPVVGNGGRADKFDAGVARWTAVEVVEQALAIAEQHGDNMD